MKYKKKRDQQRKQKIQPLIAKTENQKQYVRSIIDNDVTMCVGPAGTGKSFVASGLASEHLHRNKIEQVIITRPMVCTGRDIGAMPGDVGEKIKPYLMPMEENLKHFLGQALYGAYFNQNKIRYEPLETMRGATFHNAYMILDEAQNCTLEQIKMFITRMGEDSKVIINGDVKQTDLHHRSGLQTCIDKLDSVAGVGVVRLDYEDIQRHSIVGAILAALEQ
jgi:phosphate starvation-inducible PhoH-like protein